MSVVAILKPIDLVQIRFQKNNKLGLRVASCVTGLLSYYRNTCMLLMLKVGNVHVFYCSMEGHGYDFHQKWAPYYRRAGAHKARVRVPW